MSDDVRYLVIRPLAWAGGTAQPGDELFGSWLDGRGEALARQGFLGFAGTVVSADVPETDLTVGTPDWRWKSPAEIADEEAAAAGPDSEDPDVDDTDTGNGAPDGASVPGPFAEVLALPTVQVLAWADDHPDDVVALTEAELARPKPRKGLIDVLSARVKVSAEPTVPA